MIQTGLEYMYEVYGLYIENYGYYLVIGILFFLLLTKYRTRRSVGILGICGIIWLLFLNPIVIYLVCSMKGGETGRYARVFWLFPFIIGIAYTAVKLMKKREIYQKILVLLLVSVLLFSTGGTILNGNNFAKRSNLYKIPEEVILVADKIEEHADPSWEYPYVMSTIYLSTYLRQYDGNIRQYYGREAVTELQGDLYSKIYYYAADEIPYDELYEIGWKAVENGINMIVLDKYQVQSQVLDTVGYARVDETDRYYIYKYNGFSH